MKNPLVIDTEQVLSVDRCCNSVCVMSTDKGPHWGDVSVFDEEYWEYENTKNMGLYNLFSSNSICRSSLCIA